MESLRGGERQRTEAAEGKEKEGGRWGGENADKKSRSGNGRRGEEETAGLGARGGEARATDQEPGSRGTEQVQAMKIRLCFATETQAVIVLQCQLCRAALQTCWHMGSYKSQIALVTELLRLQQKNLLPSEVTAEDISQFLVEESKSTLRVQLWEFELEDYDIDVRPLLRMVWEVNTSMKMRDIEFEARRLLNFPEATPPQLQHPKIISQAQIYAKNLTEQQQEARGPKLLNPREVVIEVVPKVLQGFWLPPPTTFLNMPSQQLSTMAVGVTKAVEDRVATAMSSILCQVPFSRSIRDNLVLSIQEKVRQGHAQEVLVKKLNRFATEVLNIIADFAAREICALFQPQTHTSIQPAVSEQVQQPTSAAVFPPPAPLTPHAEPPASIGFNPPAEQPATGLELKSAVDPAPPCPMSPPAEVIPSVLDTGHRIEEPTTDLDSATDSAPPHPVSPQAEEPPSVLNPENNSQKTTRDTDSPVVPASPFPVSPVDEPPFIAANQEDVIFSQVEPVQQPTPSPEPPHMTPPAEVIDSVLDAENKCAESTKEQNSAVDPAPPCPMSPPAEVIPSVLDTEHRSEEPTKDQDSAIESTPSRPVSPQAEEPPSVLDPENNNEKTTREPDSATDSAPPCPPSPPAEEPPSVLNPEINSQKTTRDTDSPVVPASPFPVNPADEPPVIAANQEDVIFSQVEPVQQPTPSPEPPHVTPPAEVIDSVLDAENKCAESTKEQNSAVDPAPPCPMSPPAEVIPSVLDTENWSEEPTREPDPALVSSLPAHVTPSSESPAINAEQDDLIISQDEAKKKTRGRIQRLIHYMVVYNERSMRKPVVRVFLKASEVMHAAGPLAYALCSPSP
ncbi:hypothetical protein L3Q82_013602 [Scortum barcoo]|uniref:Uncharacterized protein n=1 Tax=Scortum barcoo TaxID=214431 RepID=A0ACB8W185_9TELE|nr:hypothetical protein L3Q82_013602 [Scortum barcoo]